MVTCLEDLGNEKLTFENPEEAMQKGLDQLEKAIGDMDIDDIANIGLSKDPYVHATAEIMGELLLLLYWTGQKQSLCACACHVLIMCLQRGMAPAVSRACAYLAGVGYGELYKNYAAANKMGKLSVALADRYDPYRAEFSVSNVKVALVERTQTTLRHILGAKTLQDCIENREAIAHEIQEITRSAAREWGVKIESILIKDLQFSKDLQESLSAAAQAKRMGNAKVISAKAEVDSAKLMRAAADILNTPAAMQIRYLETMQGLAKAPNTRVIYLPSDNNTNNMGPVQVASYQALTNQ